MSCLTLHNNSDMLSIKLALRLLLRKKLSSLINIFGLALGIGSFLLISIYAYNELQYDRFHEQGKNIYRLSGNTFNPNSHSAILPLRFYPIIKEKVPEIEEVVRVQGAFGSPNLVTDEISFAQAGILFVDPEFMNVFSFQLISGNMDAFADDPNSILISKEMASRFFGDEDPVGKILRYYDAFNLVVRGVLEDVPAYSHLQFSALINIDFQRIFNATIFEIWGSYTTTYYMLVRENTNIGTLENKLLTLYAEAVNPAYTDGTRNFYLQPLSKVYLGSGEISSPTVPILTGNQSAVYIFSVSAILILLLACLNFVNLTSAKSTMRAREVGVRKVLGAGKRNLISKFFAESLLIVFISMILGIVFVELVFPYFSDFAGKDIGLYSIPLGILVINLVLLLLIVTTLSGLYPAFVLTRFQPVTVLKGSAALIGRQLQGRSGPNFRLRQILIVLQFAISTGLIISSLAMFNQTRHALTHSGFDSESLIVLRNYSDDQMTNRYHAIRNELEQYPFIKQISAGTHIPTQRLGYVTRLQEPHKSRDESAIVYLTYVDFGYLETLGVKLSSGRFFDIENATDSTETVIINRTAAKELGIKEADEILLAGFGGSTTKRVIGIVEDIHFRSVLEPVNPKAFYINHEFYYQPPASNHILIKYDTKNLSEVISSIELAWAKNAREGRTADYIFMDAHYESLYLSELQTGRIALIFTFLAILIAALGLLGTTAYVMEARKKELGIRQVLGATILRLSTMISREFALLIILANVIAWPLTFYLMTRWLDKFAYRAEMSIWIFLLAGLASLLLALSVVNIMVFKQARQNPVHVLKYE